MLACVFFFRFVCVWFAGLPRLSFSLHSVLLEMQSAYCFYMVGARCRIYPFCPHKQFVCFSAAGKGKPFSFVQAPGLEPMGKADKPAAFALPPVYANLLFLKRSSLAFIYKRKIPDRPKSLSGILFAFYSAQRHGSVLSRYAASACACATFKLSTAASSSSTALFTL